MSLVTRSDRPEGVPPPTAEWSSEEIVAVLSISYRQLSYLKRIGAVSPVNEVHTGVPARWSIATVIRLGVIAGLQRAGFTLEAAVALSEVRADG